jgi:glycosyltransferase involved in cell wall biosynthesis
MEIVRYSPREVSSPGFIGQDALIRFYKDPAEYGPWNGDNERVITFAQSMRQRNTACNFSLFEEATRPFNRHLFGPGNEGLEFSTGKVPFERLKQEMRDARCYFYTGTHPASYTLNLMESMMSGCPIVAIGPRHGNAHYFPGHNLYEIPDFIQNFVNGFISDDIDELRSYISLLLQNKEIAQQISKETRKTAIQLFGKEKIAKQWKDYLGD